MFKKMIDIVMDVENSALRLLTESMQNLWMKDVAGENMGTVVNYLIGALVLLQNCAAIPTDTMGLLNDAMVSADCNEFTRYMTSIYFASKRENLFGGYMDYLDLDKAKYWTLYRKEKWTKKDVKSESEFGNNEDKDGYGQENRERKRCHNCGKINHLARTCWEIGGGEYSGGRGGRSGRGGYGRDDRGGRNTNTNNASFPGVNESAIRNPPRSGEPRNRTLSDGTEVNWCGFCGSGGAHYRA